MNEASIRNRGKTRTTLSRAYAFALAISMLLAFTAGGAYAAAPIAGTNIGNQATASYYDSVQGKTVNVTSNTVTTTVQQVASLTLAIDAQTKTVSVGGTVYFMHTVTNTGNGNDYFTLAAVKAGGSPNISVPATVYSDNSGTPGTALSPAQTITLAPGASFNFWYSAVASSSAVSTDTATATVTATSNFNGTVKATNTDTINVTPYANLAVTKLIDSVTTAGGTTTIQYRVHYVNNGSNTATAFTISDAVPAGTSYVANSGRWSVTGATVLTDADKTDAQGISPNTIIYDEGVTASNTVTAVIGQVLAGNTGDLTYQVSFPATAAGGTVITNTANYTYNDGSGGTQPKGSGTATISYTVPVVRAVAVTDAGSTTDSDSTVNGTVLVASAPQGGVVWFDNVVQNNGNVADTYQMSNTGSTFPASTIQYYDGLNGNLLPGGVSNSIPAGSSAHVWVKVTLAPNGTGGPFQLTLVATSSNDATKSGSDTDKLTAITSAAVDVTYNTARTDSAPAGTAATGNAATTGFGVQATGEATAVATVNGSSTTPAVFPLYLNNTGANDEAYILSYSNSGTSSTALPSGWTVAFTAAPASGVCSVTNLGAALNGNTTGTITHGTNAQICAVVTPPAGATGGTAVDVYFKATGANTGAFDIIHNAVSVTKAYSVTITPNNTGLIAPNGSKIYQHAVTNNSNLAVAVNAGDLLFTVPANSNGSWSAILCADSACSTVLTSTTGTDGKTYYDIKQLPGLASGLAAGGTVNVYVKVQAPATTVGDVNTTTISLASAKSAPAYKIIASATDTTTMSLANTTIQKYQALDANCDNNGGAGFSAAAWTQGNITTGAVPGACIRYKLVVNNGGNQAATTLTVTDLVPPYTVYNKLGNCFPGTGGTTGASGDINGTAIAAASISEPTACTAAASGVSVIFGTTGNELTLNGGATATLYFEVQITK